MSASASAILLSFSPIPARISFQISTLFSVEGRKLSIGRVAIVFPATESVSSVMHPNE
jgi:hypothetical protein